VPCDQPDTFISISYQPIVCHTKARYIYLRVITAHNVPYQQPNTFLTCHYRPQCARLVFAVETALFCAQYELNSYVVTLECSRNHIISENYKTLLSFKLPPLRHSLFVQLYFSPSDCKGGGNISGNHFAKALFSSPVAVLMMS